MISISVISHLEVNSYTDALQEITSLLSSFSFTDITQITLNTVLIQSALGSTGT